MAGEVYSAARQEAVGLYRSGGWLKAIQAVDMSSDNLPAPSTPEAEELVNQLKPLYYAGLAEAISVVIDYSLDKREERAPYGFRELKEVEDDPGAGPPITFDSLIISFERTLAQDLIHCQETSEGGAPFSDLESVAKILAQLVPHRHKTALAGLRGGINTAATGRLC
ncbi:MAG TPA: hypothetical protein VLG37_02860 [Candidatus Saccharimonadales bacterium]|nr:hypothetical protein [Candidatus Saccharimonadales bacterium]